MGVEKDWEAIARCLAEQVALLYGELTAAHGDAEPFDEGRDKTLLKRVHRALSQLPARGTELDEDEWVQEASRHVLDVACHARATEGKQPCEDCGGAGYHVEVVSHAGGVEQVQHRCAGCDGEGVWD